MTCRLLRPTAQDNFDFFLNSLSNTVLKGNQVIPESNEWYVASLHAAMAESFYAISEEAWKSKDPREACLQDLIRMAEADGVYPLPALPAQGYVKLTGVAGTVLPSPLSFDIDGNTYQTATNETQPTAIATDGTAVIRVTAISSGEAGNLTAATGTLTTTVAGVDASVEVCGGVFCSGSDAETEAQFRARYLRSQQYSNTFGNAWILDKLAEWPCATRALLREGTCCSCSGQSDGNGGCEECRGKPSYYVMFDSSFPNGVAPQSVTDEIEQWMFGSPQGYGLGQVGIGVCGSIATIQTVDVSVSIELFGCPTVTQVDSVTDLVNQYFSTVEPSKPVNTSQIESSIFRVLGIESSVRITLDDPNLAYGPTVRTQNADTLVYQTACDLEPDCDVLLTLNQLVVTTNATASGGCPQ